MHEPSRLYRRHSTPRANGEAVSRIEFLVSVTFISAVESLRRESADEFISARFTRNGDDVGLRIFRKLRRVAVVSE